jgi:hypothetical protein
MSITTAFSKLKLISGFEEKGGILQQGSVDSSLEIIL